MGKLKTRMCPLLDDYTIFVRECAVYPEARSGSISELMYLGLGLAGEVGETIEVIKKVYRDNPMGWTDARREKIILELGDAMWYMTRLIDSLGLDYADIIGNNVAKLTQRMVDGTVKDESKR